MYIDIESTPNPNTMKFVFQAPCKLPDQNRVYHFSRAVDNSNSDAKLDSTENDGKTQSTSTASSQTHTDSGHDKRTVQHIRDYPASPFATAIFRHSDVKDIMITSGFASITKHDDADWSYLQQLITATIVDFILSGLPAVTEICNEDKDNDSIKANLMGGDLSTRTACDASLNSDESGKSYERESNNDEYQYSDVGQRIVDQILAILSEQIAPAVQADGGYIEFVRFDEQTGILYLKMLGACSGCPSASITLKNGIERMMRYYVPEVEEVMQVM